MLTIGQMSKACSVTVKTLHHYDKIGLLKASEVDEFTGYRYYSEDQISTMLLIDRYKRYGFSLSDIQDLLKQTDPRELRRQLKFQRIRLERQREYISVTMGEIDRHMEEFERTGDIMSYQNQYQVIVKESERLVLATARNTMSVDEFGHYYGGIYERIAKTHLTPSGVTLAIYHDDEFDPAASDIELGVEILEEDKADRILEPVQCAVTMHQGPYSSLPDAYGKVVAWMKAEGWQIAGCPFEIYRKTGFDKLPPEEWETEIFFPVKR